MICLTFDTDYMRDDWLDRFLRELPIPGRATFFCHRRYGLLDDTDHEIGPHPFLSSLDRWQEELQSITKDSASSPTGIRMHSCVFSHMIGIGLSKMGYVYSSNMHVLFDDQLQPYRHPWGLWELPIYYMDCLDFWMAKNWPPGVHQPFHPSVIDKAVSGESLFVFGFHPLHIALNTTGPREYGRAKQRILEEGLSPFELACPGRGVRTFYEDLCEAMAGAGRPSHGCREALEHFGCL